MPESVKQMSAAALQNRLKGSHPPELLDVREPWEWGIAHLEGAHLIPLGLLPELMRTLDPKREIVVYCHHGLRSQQAAGDLATAGFQSVWNLIGGLEGWRTEVDSAMPGY